MYKKYEPNKKGKDFVVGDIHGCFSDLETKLKDIGFDKNKDRLFSVGDLTDRGPESERAIDFIGYDWFYPIRGNHEDIILQCWRDLTTEQYWHFQNGGIWISSMSGEWIRKYISEIEKLPLIIQVGEYGIIHSTISVLNSWDEVIKSPNQFQHDLLWSRDFNIIGRNPVQGISGIFAGHSINPEPMLYGNILDIDTGAFLNHWYKKGKLTIVEMVHDA